MPINACSLHPASHVSTPPPRLSILYPCSPQVQSFVSGLFDMGRDLKAFKTHLRDFLIQVLEFKSGDGADSLFAEEHAAAQKEDLERRKAVPGLLNPYQQQEMDEL